MPSLLVINASRTRCVKASLSVADQSFENSDCLPSGVGINVVESKWVDILLL